MELVYEAPKVVRIPITGLLKGLPIRQDDQSSFGGLLGSPEWDDDGSSGN